MAPRDGLEPLIHDVKGTGFGEKNVEYIDIVQFAIGDMYKGWDVATQIQQGMKFDRGFCGSEQCPREYGKTEIDG
jgi:hypothetical protein